MSLVNLSIAYTNMRNALESVCWKFGTWKEIEHIEYCRWCGWSKGWVAQNGHGDKCPIKGGSVANGS